MTSLELMSRLNYLLGRFEGIAIGLQESQQAALLDTCEWLQEIIDELDPEETVSANDRPVNGKVEMPPPQVYSSDDYSSDEWEALKKEFGIDTMCEVKL